jgi:hypothetical protein
VRHLDETDDPRGLGDLSIPGQVNGDFAVWTRATHRGWDVVVYRISTRQTTVLHRPAGVFAQYAPAVTPDGTLYYVRSGNGCGVTVSLLSKRPGKPPETWGTLPKGIDVMDTYAFARSSDQTDVLYDPLRCRSYFADIYGETFGGEDRAVRGGSVPTASASGPKRVFRPDLAPAA